MSHQHNVDSPISLRELGTIILALRKDAGGNQASADGNYVYLTVDKDGSLRVDGSIGQLDNTLPVMLVIDPATRAQNEMIIDLLGQMLEQLQRIA